MIPEQNRIADRFEQLMHAVSPTFFPDVERQIEAMTLTQVWAFVKEQRARSDRPWAPCTIRNGQQSINHFVKHVGDLPVAALRHRDVWDAVRHAEGLTVVVRNKTLGHVAGILRYLHRRGLLGWRPDVGYPLPWQRNPVHVPTIEDLDALYTGLIKTFPTREPITKKMNVGRRKSLLSRTALVLQYFGGFRRSAVLKLTYGDVYPGAIKMYVPKTGKLHCVPLHPVLERHLKRLCTQHGRHFEYWQAATTAHDKMPPSFSNRKVFLGLGADELNNMYAKGCKRGKVGYIIKSHDIRRASITQWSLISETCWRFVHGIGHERQVMPYFSQEAILRKYMYRLPVPRSWLTGQERNRKQMDRDLWINLFDVLSDYERQSLVTFLESMIEGHLEGN